MDAVPRRLHDDVQLAHHVCRLAGESKFFEHVPFNIAPAYAWVALLAPPTDDEQLKALMRLAGVQRLPEHLEHGADMLINGFQDAMSMVDEHNGIIHNKLFAEHHQRTCTHLLLPLSCSTSACCW
jgi:hypothetical protein